MYHILYVDDEPALLDSAKMFLERDAEFRVDTMTSASEAFLLLATSGYDAIISDYQMPGMDGIQFLRQVRSAANSIPFILFTGRGREEVVIQALNAGADFYLQKGGDAASQYAELAHQIRHAVDRNRAEEALQESRERLDTIFSATQVGMILVDAETHTILQANPKALSLIGAQECEVTGTICHQFICPAEQGRCPVTDLGQEVNSSERVLITKKGGRVPILKTVVPARLGDKNLLVESFFDITDRKITEQALAESEERFRVLLQNVPSVAVQGYRMDGTTNYWNTASEILYGYTAAEALGRNLVELIIPSEMRDDVKKAIAFMAETGSPIPASELLLMRKDGSRVPVFSCHAVVRTAQGEPELFCLDIDLTERRKVEDALRESEDKYRRLAENAQDMIYRMSLPDGVYRYVSPSAGKVTGYPPEEFYANPFLIRQILSAGCQDYFRKEWEALLEGKINPVYEYAITDRDGKTRWLNQRNVLVRDDQGSPVAIEGIVTDVTLNRQTEGALRKANAKLKLLSGITRHDINNQLQVLTAHLGILEMKQPDPGYAADFQQAKSAAERISAMIQFMQEYEDIGIKAPAWHDSRLLVDSIARQIPLGDITLINEIPAGAEVFADPLITRVWYNLLDNAVRYGRKTTTIRCSLHKARDAAVFICEDNGDGVPDGEKTRIFERGFGKNTGMGLFLAREILTITSIGLSETGEQGKGARFEMAVPDGFFRMVPQAVTGSGSALAPSFPAPAPGNDLRGADALPVHGGNAGGDAGTGQGSPLPILPPLPTSEYIPR